MKTKAKKIKTIAKIALSIIALILILFSTLKCHDVKIPSIDSPLTQINNKNINVKKAREYITSKYYDDDLSKPFIMQIEFKGGFILPASILAQNNNVICYFSANPNRESKLWINENNDLMLDTFYIGTYQYIGANYQWGQNDGFENNYMLTTAVYSYIGDVELQHGLNLLNTIANIMIYDLFDYEGREQDWLSISDMINNTSTITDIVLYSDNYNGTYTNLLAYEQAILVDGYDAAFKDGYDSGYSRGYDSGYESGSSDGYDNGYLTGRVDGYDNGKADGEQIGYDKGYSKGLQEGQESNLSVNWIYNIFYTIQGFLEIEILPNIRIAYIAGVVLVLSVILMILKLIR